MNHPHYELVALSGAEPLRHIDNARGIENGKPAQATRLARQLDRFRPEPVVYHPDVPMSERVDATDGKSQPAGAAAVDILLSQIGADRIVDLLHASPRVRAAMEAHLEEELVSPGLAPAGPAVEVALSSSRTPGRAPRPSLSRG